MVFNNNCNKCLVELNEENISRGGKNGFRGICKSCRNIRERRKHLGCLTCYKPCTRTPKSVYCSDLCRLLKLIDKIDSCWLWKGTINKHGYGFAKYNKKNISAHRVFYQLYKGEIPKDLHILHTCDVRKCVNPEHLFIGTNDDNMKDMCSKERAYAPKLNKDDVLEIRKTYDKKPYFGIFVDLAKKYNASPAHIRNIILRKKWKHV